MAAYWQFRIRIAKADRARRPSHLLRGRPRRTCLPELRGQVIRGSAMHSDGSHRERGKDTAIRRRADRGECVHETVAGSQISEGRSKSVILQALRCPLESETAT